MTTPASTAQSVIPEDGAPARVRVDRAELDRFGSVVHVRDLGPGDLPSVQRLLEGLSPRSVYQRFLTAAPDCASYAAELVDPGTTLDAVVAIADGVVVGVASTHPFGAGRAEFAEAVADPVQGHGLGTLMLEALVERSADRGLRRLEGEMLTANAQMVDVLRHAGLQVQVRTDGPVSEVVIDLGDLSQLAAAHLRRHDSAHRAALPAVPG